MRVLRRSIVRMQHALDRVLCLLPRPFDFLSVLIPRVRQGSLAALDEVLQSTLDGGRERLLLRTRQARTGPRGAERSKSGRASMTRISGSAPFATRSTSSHNRGVETVGVSRALSRVDGDGRLGSVVLAPVDEDLPFAELGAHSGDDEIGMLGLEHESERVRKGLGRLEVDGAVERDVDL